MSGMPGPETITHVDEIKRTTSPQTTNATRCEVQLSAIPSREVAATLRETVARAQEPKSVTADADELDDEPGGDHRLAGRRPELIGRGTAAGYTGAYREPGTVDIQEVVAVQTARGPE